DRVVVSGDDVVQLLGITVGIADADQRDAQSVSLLYTDSFLLGIYNEDSVRQSLHLFDAAQVLLQFLHLLAQSDNFLLGQYVKGTVLLHRLDLFQSLDTALNGFEVGQHSAQPSLIYIE